MIKISPSATIEKLRQTIREDLGITNNVNIKLYMPIGSENHILED